MQNEFEKQVQQKMDELHFVPTPPVWEKIEEQIRRKKERRRFFLWLPLFFLLAGNASWWLLTAPAHEGKTGHQAVAHSTANKPTATQPAANATIVSSSALPTEPQSSALSPAPPTDATQSASTPQNLAHSSSHTPVSGLSKSSITHVSASGASDKRVAASGTYPVDTLDFDYFQQSEMLKQIAREENTSSVHIVSSSISYSPSVPYFHSFFALTPLHPSAFHLPVLLQQSAERTTPHKRNLIGLNISGGWLGLSQTTGRQDVVSYSSGPLSTSNTLPRSPLVSDGGPLPVSGRRAFAVGVTGERRLSAKLGLSAGLGYSYFSTQIGEKTSSSMDVRTAFPFGGSFSGSSKQSSTYTNRFHFISLPVALHLDAPRRLPLGLYAGITVRQLLATNALQYNYATQAYDKSAGSFHHTQLYSNIGIDYTLKGTRSEWRIGPQFEYGISRLSSGGPHLYDFSLRLQYLLRK